MRNQLKNLNITYFDPKLLNNINNIIEDLITSAIVYL